MSRDRHDDEAPGFVLRTSRPLPSHVPTGILVCGLGGARAGNRRDARARGAVVDVPPLREGDPELFAEWATFGLPKYHAEEPYGWAERTVAELLLKPGALGEYLEDLPPGRRLATVLDAVDVDKVDDFSLVEVVAAYRRMESWSAARTARAAAALAERDALNPTRPGNVAGRTNGECVVGQELAMRLRVSKLTAVRLAACGRAFGQMFQPTGAALEQGLIDFPRAQAIVMTLVDLPAEVALAAQLDVLDKAPGRTLRQVHHDLAKAVIAVDPDSADARHRAARKKRCVNRPRPLADGMAGIWAVLPAADAIALDTALEASARAAKNNGDERTLDQLRADSLAHMAHTALALGHIGPRPGTDCTPESPCGGRADGSGAVDSASVNASSATPPTTSPPATPAAPAADGPPRPGHRLPGRSLPWIKLGMLGGGRADIRVTIPLNVLVPDPSTAGLSALERDPEPVAELEGYGPICPLAARALAEGGVWRRLVTDPLGSVVLDVGRTRYQPPAPIAEHVRERDGTCVRPGCSTPARSCDLDHIHEYQHGGATSTENLGPLCTTDHPVKTIGAFTLAYGSDRTYAWTTPTGHGYLRRPDATIITLPRRTAEHLRALGKRWASTGQSVDPAVVDAVLAELAAGTDAGGTWQPAPDTPAARAGDATGPAWTGDASGPSWTGDATGASWTGDDAPPF